MSLNIKSFRLTLTLLTQISKLMQSIFTRLELINCPIVVLQHQLNKTVLSASIYCHQAASFVFKPIVRMFLEAVQRTYILTIVSVHADSFDLKQALEVANLTPVPILQKVIYNSPLLSSDSVEMQFCYSFDIKRSVPSSSPCNRSDFVQRSLRLQVLQVSSSQFHH